MIPNLSGVSIMIVGLFFGAMMSAVACSSPNPPMQEGDNEYTLNVPDEAELRALTKKLREVRTRIYADQKIGPEDRDLIEDYLRSESFGVAAVAGGTLFGYAKASPAHAREALEIVESALPRDPMIWDNLYWVDLRKRLQDMAEAKPGTGL